jgi:hypothetical protein
MTEKKTRQKEYLVQARLQILVTVPVRCQTLQAALDYSKTLKDTDFVKVLGEYIDGVCEISGVYESETF